MKLPQIRIGRKKPRDMEPKEIANCIYKQPVKVTGDYLYVANNLFERDVIIVTDKPKEVKLDNCLVYGRVIVVDPQFMEKWKGPR